MKSDLTIEVARYAKNVVAVYHAIRAGEPPRTTLRSVSDDADQLIQSLVDQFVKAPMVDDAGAIISFLDLPYESQEVYLAAWQEKTKLLVLESTTDVTQQEQAADALSQVSDAMEASGLTDAFSSRDLRARSVDYLIMIKTRLDERLASQPSRARVGSGEVDGPFLLDAGARDFVLKHYHEGYIISGFGGDPLDPVRVAGHDSILGALNIVYRGEPRVENIDYDQSTIGYSATGSNQSGSVRPDKLKSWVNWNGWIASIEIGRPKYVYWKWTVKVLGVWVGGEYRTKYPSDAQCLSAYNNAKSHNGKPYEWPGQALTHGLERTDKFWCASLVWRAWYDVSDNYDLNYNHWWSPNVLSPLDIVQNSWRYDRVARW